MFNPGKDNAKAGSQWIKWQDVAYPWNGKFTNSQADFSYSS